MKLALYLSISILVAVSIAVASVGYFSFIFTKDTLIGEVSKQQQEIALNVLNTIDRTLYQKYQEIQLIADANPIEDVFISGEITVRDKNRLNEFLLQTGPWDDLELFTVDGKKVQYHKGEEDMHIGRQDNEGKIAFTQALQGEVYVSDVFFSKEIGRPTIIFSAPVMDKIQADNMIIGVVIGKFSWPIIMEILDEVSLEVSHIHLFNKEGMTIATPTIHKNEILQYDLTSMPIEQQGIQRICNSSFIYEEESYWEIINKAEGEYIPTLSSCLLHEGYLGFKNKGWGLVIETPQKIILQPVNQLILKFLLVSIIVILIFIPLIFLVSRQITKPLSDLSKSNRLISEGKFKEAQQQQQQNLPNEIKELMETRQIALKGLVAKSDLEKAYKELKELDKLKSVFLSMTSHELKTPITPIKSQAESLLAEIRGKLNKNQKESVEMILRNTNHLNELLTDVLDSAKLEANQLKMFPEKTDLKPLIQNIIKDIEQTAHQKNVTIISTIEKLPVIMIDGKRFKQVLLNLVGNSVKYTPPSGKITISAKQQTKKIIVTVTDTGIGISSNMLTKIFDKFVQSSLSYKLKQKGTGLGLSICKGIVTKFGGKIWAESKGKNKGASFHFTIPIKNTKF